MAAAEHNSESAISDASAGAVWKTVSNECLTWSRIEAQLRQPLPTPPIELWVVRHGETTSNAQGLVTGTSDSRLTEEGHRQAIAAGRQLSGHSFEIAWCSTLRRSRETLQDILEAGELSPGAVLEDERIRERSLGKLELTPALPIPEFAVGDLSFAPPGGESYEEVTRRCLSFLIDLIQMAVALETRTKLLVCSHVGPMRIFAGIVQKLSDPAKVLALQFPNSSPLRFEVAHLEFPRFLRNFRKQQSPSTS